MNLEHLEYLLGAYSYRLNIPHMAPAVFGVMKATGRDLFGRVANLDRLGFHPDICDRRILKEGPPVAACFGWFFCSMTNKWHRYTDARAVYDGMSNILEVHKSNPVLDACHDLYQTRTWIDTQTGKPITPILSRITKNHC